MNFNNEREQINEIIRNYRQLNADANRALEESSVNVDNLEDFQFGYLRQSFIQQCSQELQGLLNESNSNEQNQYIFDSVSWVNDNF